MLRCRMLRHGAHQVNSCVVVGVERAADVDEAAREMIRSSSSRSSGSWPMAPRLALLRVHVHVGARDVQVAAEDERPRPRPCAPRRSASIASRKRILAGKSLPPFGT